MAPGENTYGPNERRVCSGNVLEHDKSVQRTAILLNLRIGDRLLELMSIPNPELELEAAV